MLTSINFFRIAMKRADQPSICLARNFSGSVISSKPRNFVSKVSFSNTKLNIEDDIVVTKACASRIKHLQASKGQDLILRLAVDSGGCSGYQYTFSMEQPNIAEDDKVYERDGAKVVIDPVSFEFVKGATVDFEQDLMRSAFAVVNNPQSESACGCKSSFAIKNFSAHPALD